MDCRKRNCISLLALIGPAALMFASLASAQQVTYYSFDNGVNTETNPNASGVCTLPNSANNPLLCLNAEVTAGYDGTGQNTFPLFTYPDYLIPGASEDSEHSELLMNQSRQGNGESVWFSRAQKIKNGFTNYFAFEVNPNTSVGTADGIAFVIQNAQGASGADSGSGCSESGSGVTVLGSNGGCMGYGGVDNSLAIEFDTFLNSYDPNNNHIAIQSCGTAQNTVSHNTSCTIAIKNTLPFTIADGNIHQVVVEYSGDPNHSLQVFVDPPFVPGTFTPCTAADNCADGAVATPIVSATYDIGSKLNLITSADGQDSAYVGFTAATGASAEVNQILDWTYTPHSTSTEVQPIDNTGQQTSFPFGDHTYGVTYPSGDAGTSPPDMIVDANTISPMDFSTLMIGTPFQGSVCQVYDGTGGNCIIYSVHCVAHGMTNKVPCPATSDPTIAVKTAYDSSITPISPGFLQGDPLYSPIATIGADGTTATVTCTGECAVSDGESVSIRNSSNASLDAENVTASVSDPSVVDSFTYPTSKSGSGTGGFVTSGNVQNICNAPDDPVPCWQPQKIDGTTSGKTKNFSGLVALYETVNAVNTTTTIIAPAVAYGVPAEITVSVSPDVGSGPVTGSVTLTVDGTPLSAQTLSDGSTIFSVPGLSAGPHSLSASYGGNVPFVASSATGSLTVTPSPVAQIVPASIDFGTVYVLSITTKTVTITNVGNAAMTITAPLIQIVKGGNSKEFVSVNLCPKSLAAGKHCTMTVSFVAGPVYTPRTAILTINDNAPGNPHTVPLTASVINPQATLSTGSINFGNQKKGTPSPAKSVVLSNTGATTLSISNIGLSGGNLGDFTISASTCGASLDAGHSCSLSLTFTPSSKGSRSSSLTITDNARTGTQKVALSGKGT